MGKQAQAGMELGREFTEVPEEKDYSEGPLMSKAWSPPSPGQLVSSLGRRGRENTVWVCAAGFSAYITLLGSSEQTLAGTCWWG